MLSSHSWWKWSEPTITSTSGLARVSVSRNASDLADPFVGERRPVLAGGRAGPVVERMVGGGDDRDDAGPWRGSFQSVGGVVDGRCGRRCGRSSMPSGRRRSSARCPSSPAARASSAKPRSSSTGRPRSARAAPHTPAPLSGRVRPSTCGWTRPIASNSRRCGPRSPSSSAMRDQHRGSRVLHLVHGVAEPGHELASAARRGARPRPAATASQPASSVGVSPDRRACRRGTGRSPR